MYKKLTKAILVSSLTIITFSSLVYLYDVREKIFDLIKSKFGITQNKTVIENLSERFILDEKYAKLILDGNFILFLDMPTEKNGLMYLRTMLKKLCKI